MTTEVPGRFFCPVCNRKYKFVEALANKKVICHCGSKIRCPDNPTGDAELVHLYGEAPPTPFAPPVDQDGGPPRPAPAPAVDIPIDSLAGPQPTEEEMNLPVAKAQKKPPKPKAAAPKAKSSATDKPKKPSGNQSLLDELAALAGDDDDLAEDSVDSLVLHDDQRGEGSNDSSSVGGSSVSTAFNPEESAVDAQIVPQPIANEPRPVPRPTVVEDSAGIELDDEEPADAAEAVDAIMSLADQANARIEQEADDEAPALSLSADDDDEPATTGAAAADDDDAYEDAAELQLADEDADEEDEPNPLAAVVAASHAGAAAADADDEDYDVSLGGPGAAGDASVCPHCQSKLTKGSILCLACGYNLELGRVVNTNVQVDPDEEEKANEAPAHLVNDVYIPAGLLLFGFLFLCFNLLIVFDAKGRTERAIELSQKTNFVTAGGFGNPTGDSSLMDESQERKDEESFYLEAHGINAFDEAAVKEILTRGGDLDGDGDLTDVEVRLLERAEHFEEKGQDTYHIVDRKNGEKDLSLAERADLAGVATPGQLRIAEIIKTSFWLILAVPSAVVGMFVVISMFGNPFGAVIPALIKLLGLVLLTQCTYQFTELGMDRLTEGFGGLAYMVSFSTSVTVYASLCYYFFELDWIEGLVLYLCTWFVPKVALIFCFIALVM